MNKALLIVGMHRSGTSALAGALSILGVDVGADLLPAKSGENERGFFELREVHSFHERLLISGGRTWDTPSPLISSWLDRFATRSSKAELVEILKRNFTDSELWAVKDPRLCQLLPLWREILADLTEDVAVIHIVREPDAVAASLARRNGFTDEKSGVLWLDHNLAAERDSRGMQRVFLTYEGLIENKMKALDRLAVQLGVEWPRSGDAIREEIDRFLSRDLDHSQDRSPEGNRQFGRWTDAVTELERLLRDLAESGGSFDEARKAFDHLEVQQETLVAGFDPILLDHCAHLVLGAGGLRDLQRGAESAEDALEKAEIYAKQVEAALRARENQEEQTKKFVASLETDLTAHRKHSEELRTYASALESQLEEKETQSRLLEREVADQAQRIARHDQALREAARYTKVVESEIEKYRVERNEVADQTKILESQLEVHRAERDKASKYTEDLESQIEVHRAERDKASKYTEDLESQIEVHRAERVRAAEYTKSLESELKEHKTQQAETAKYIQSLLAQLEQQETKSPDLTSDGDPAARSGTRLSQTPNDLE